MRVRRKEPRPRGWNSTLPAPRFPIARRSAVKRRSTKQNQRERDQFGPHAVWIRKQPCCRCGCAPPCQAHHTLHRKHGGKARHLVPLCWKCHAKVHDVDHATSRHWSRHASKYWQLSPARSRYCPRCYVFTRGGFCGECQLLEEAGL